MPISIANGIGWPKYKTSTGKLIKMRNKPITCTFLLLQRKTISQYDEFSIFDNSFNLWQHSSLLRCIVIGCQSSKRSKFTVLQQKETRWSQQHFFLINTTFETLRFLIWCPILNVLHVSQWKSNQTKYLAKTDFWAQISTSALNIFLSSL